MFLKLIWNMTKGNWVISSRWEDISWSWYYCKSRLIIKPWAALNWFSGHHNPDFFSTPCTVHPYVLSIIQLLKSVIEFLFEDFYPPIHNNPYVYRCIFQSQMSWYIFHCIYASVRTCSLQPCIYFSSVMSAR